MITKIKTHFPLKFIGFELVGLDNLYVRTDFMHVRTEEIDLIPFSVYISETQAVSLATQY